MRPANDILLTVEGLSRSFSGVKAVDDLSFAMRRGTILGLIGPNGSGKSTTIDCLTGFMKPDGGKVSFLGKDITGHSPETIARAGLARTFQNVRVFPALALLENLIVSHHLRDRSGFASAFFGSESATVAEKAARLKGLELLDLVGLRHYADAPAGILSYGQKKLLALVMTLMPQPTLIVLDEPLAGVSPSVIRRISGLIANLSAEGQSFLIIEHNVGFVMRHCEQIVVMESGRKLAEGSPPVIQEDERVLKAYLGNSAMVARELACHAQG